MTMMTLFRWLAVENGNVLAIASLALHSLLASLLELSLLSLLGLPTPSNRCVSHFVRSFVHSHLTLLIGFQPLV